MKKKRSIFTDRFLYSFEKRLVGVLHRKVLSFLLIRSEELDANGIANIADVLDLLGSDLLELGDVNEPLLTGSVLGNLGTGSGDRGKKDLIDDLVSALVRCLKRALDDLGG